MTPAELAATLRISERTVSRMVIDGCPSLLVGARRRFVLADVIAWTKERACQSATAPMAVGMRRPSSTPNAFTEACRNVKLRVQPGAAKRG
jgi:excisionase family DNA binding protein